MSFIGHVILTLHHIVFQWARYMRCDGSPDPTNQGEINTYINLKLENKDRDDAESVLKDSQLDLAVSRGGLLCWVRVQNSRL